MKVLPFSPPFDTNLNEHHHFKNRVVYGIASAEMRKPWSRKMDRPKPAFHDRQQTLHYRYCLFPIAVLHFWNLVDGDVVGLQQASSCRSPASPAILRNGESGRSISPEADFHF